MEYHINLGMWQSVFAVPSEIVDKHIKLAGGAQLKVLLWVLRHAGENFTVEDIASALNMQPADVKDSMQYWVQTGVIIVCGGEIRPVPTETVREEPQQSAEVSAPDAAQEPLPEVRQETKAKNIATRPKKPDRQYIGKRMASDENVTYLMNSAEEILNRLLSYNDQCILVLLHDHYGLPIEVILMLLQYASEIGKGNMAYVEKVGIEWSEKEILTLELAEKRIKYLTEGRNAAYMIQRVLGQESHSPTEQEIELAERWMNEWKMTTDMIRAAYERCVDAKGKYIPNYTNTILSRWYHAGITTVEQAKAEKLEKQSKKKEDTYHATYDIAEYESTSVIFDEE